VSSGKFAWKKGWEFDDRKPCSRCATVKLLAEYSRTKAGYMGHDAMCRECRREQWAETYKPKRKSTKPTLRSTMSDELMAAYSELLFSEDDPVCLTLPDDKKDIWFAPHNTWEHLTAKGYCHSCPLFETCLNITVMTKPTTGVWAGLNPADRRAVGPADKDALRAEYEYQKANGAYMPSYLKNRKSFTRWDRTKDVDD
jgi:Transcription factor WhiB